MCALSLSRHFCQIVPADRSCRRRESLVSQGWEVLSSGFSFCQRGQHRLYIQPPTLEPFISCSLSRDAVWPALPRPTEGTGGSIGRSLQPALGAEPIGAPAGDVLGSRSTTLECLLQRPGIPAARFKGRDFLPVETLEFLKLLDASVVPKVVQPQRPVGSQDAELNLCGVGRETSIDEAAEEVRSRMLLAIPLHAPPSAATVHGDWQG